MQNESNDRDLIELRRAEVAQYDKNIAMYEAVLASLPSEWPDHLQDQRHPSNQHDVAAQIEDLTDLALLSQLWYADDVRRAIRTETVERTKAAAILEALERMQTAPAVDPDAELTDQA
jgi:hypothetical protein